MEMNYIHRHQLITVTINKEIKYTNKVYNYVATTVYTNGSYL